jgi:hypothetical protein
VRLWRGCCVRETPGRTPRLITSRCSIRRWRPCLPRPGRCRVIRIRYGWWSARTHPGATHAFAQVCRDRGVWFSFGFPVDARIQAIVDRVPGHCWEPAIETDGGIRDGAWVARGHRHA